MTESLYIVIGRGRWNYPRIEKIAKKKPLLKRPTEQALLRLVIVISDNVLQPREVKVVIDSEHIVRPAVSVTSQPAL